MKLYGLDLFSGIGGLSMAVEPYVRTIAYCEQDQYCQGVLLSRMREGRLDRAPIWDDVTTLQARMLPSVDIIFGGFPCQDISVAGRGEGLVGERSGLFFEIVRLAKETRAPFVFLENVPAIRTRGLREVVRTLAEMGYDCRWTCLSASSVGANHKRERWFLLAYSDSSQLRHEQGRRSEASWPGENESSDNGVSRTLADSKRLGSFSRQHERRSRHQEGIFEGGSSSMADSNSVRELSEQKTRDFSSDRYGHGDQDGIWSANYWSSEPDVGRVAHGVPFRVDRIKSLGNAVVPLQARTAFERLMGFDRGSSWD